LEGLALSYAYLAVLLFSLTGLALIDYRYKLAFFSNWRRASVSILLPVVFFLLWDLAGILLGIFFRGQTDHLTGILLAPELPVEEPFFLVLLSYTTLILFLSIRRGLAKRSGAVKPE
jgi:lycopene cyclase domain-containing protein